MVIKYEKFPRLVTYSSTPLIWVHGGQNSVCHNQELWHTSCLIEFRLKFIKQRNLIGLGTQTDKRSGHPLARRVSPKPLQTCVKTTVWSLLPLDHRSSTSGPQDDLRDVCVPSPVEVSFLKGPGSWRVNWKHFRLFSFFLCVCNYTVWSNDTNSISQYSLRRRSSLLSQTFGKHKHGVGCHFNSRQTSKISIHHPRRHW